MKPLSILKYYNNNKKRFISIFISSALSVILIYTTQMIIFSSYNFGIQSSVEPKEHYSTVSPKGEPLSMATIYTISNTEGVDKVIPCVFDNTTIYAGIGSNIGTSVLSLEYDAIPEMMRLLNLKLIEGKLPTKNNDIIIHKRVAENKNLKIGDYIGRLESKKESLPGRYEIVGIIDGPSILSFAPIDYYLDNYHWPHSYFYGGIILPKEGQLDKMNQQLDNMNPANYQIDTLNIQKAWEKDTTSKINILVSTINIFIILIVSSCIGFLSYIYFSQRRSEFGLLWALGFSRQQVINRAFAEVNGINLVGFFFGIMISLLIGLLLNLVYFTPLGDSLDIFDIKFLLGAACSPILVTLFSLIPIWRMLKKLDPVTIIDGTTL